MKKNKINKIVFFWFLFISGKAYGDYCFDLVAEKYYLSKEILMAISLVESNMDNNAINTNNSDGSKDICHMQINSQWFHLFSPEALLKDPCYCTAVGAWLLRDCMTRYGDSWRAVACYNTGGGLERRSSQGQKYIRKVKEKYMHITMGEY
ncbi:MAG: lytic transglycosylase domain-containing protein [Desulforegulaceae bacterium]|nr:lytic transglycosylase domain-containing protein [Desulforegulaceae bacterium]